jgi:AhpD family alkylhydroperoxidase
MDNSDKEKIEKIISDRKEAHQYFTGNSKTYVAFTKMAGEAFSDGALDKKTKELMAVSVSVVIKCESCMEWHIGEALRHGASEKQIVEAIDVATEMGGGPATVSARFAMKVLKYYGEKENRR